MKVRIAAVLLVLLAGVSPSLPARASGETRKSAQQDQTNGILQSVENAKLTEAGDLTLVMRVDPGAPVEMNFKSCQGIGVDRDFFEWWVLPISATGATITVKSGLWILPIDAKSKDHSWYLEFTGGEATATMTAKGLKVSLNANSFTALKSEARPHSDPFGHRFSFKMEGGAELEDALAGFYWGTMLPSVVEKTMAAKFPYSSGYVLSTLNTNSYAGSYPAVDHEFQTKGRMAMGSDADLDIVRRMIELQFKLMVDDPEMLSRAPCSVQPDGRREYHIRRNSQNNRENAAMFLVTGNIEVIEEAWHYFEATKDFRWLEEHLSNLEAATAWILANTDQYGRVWSDVYYEDQVIEDGRVTEAQVFAAHSLELMARIESVSGWMAMAAEYGSTSKKMSKVLIQSLPIGYWDGKNQRFIDWVDRDSKAHDHIHLLANTLPVTFGYATKEQAAAVLRLVDENKGQFERFPSFVAADIAGYNKSEIGSGGPYDLSAAGRYWYWDAAFRESQKQNDVLLTQLKTVAAEGAKDNYLMGERYDMDYVYYIDGKNSHGAQKYYEYPNVFTAVLISKYLGLTIPVDAEVSVAPHLAAYGSAELGTPEYALRYSYDEHGFVLKNLSDRRRLFKVNLSGLSNPSTRGAGSSNWWLLTKPNPTSVLGWSTIILSPQEEARWVRQ